MNTKRLFLMKAHKKTTGHNITPDWTWSIKLDGIRAFWDGGITRGREDVPFAFGEFASGLWSINGNIIHAPDWFLDQLPKVPCDGELWAGPGNFQLVSSYVRKQVPIDEEWEAIKYMVYDFPGLADVYCPSKMLTLATLKVDCTPSLHQYMMNAASERYKDFLISAPLPTNINGHAICRSNVCDYVDQMPVPSYRFIMDSVMPKLLENKHEGIVFRHRDLTWTPIRSNYLVKEKPFSDSEALVIGLTFGRETELGSKLKGLMGALKVRWNNKEFLVSGFTDNERRLDCTIDSESATQYAIEHAGEEAPNFIGAYYFPRGSIITFKYRELSDDGIPKDARYWRKFSE
jgi:DNA ligase-1